MPKRRIKHLWWEHDFQRNRPTAAPDSERRKRTTFNGTASSTFGGSKDEPDTPCAGPPPYGRARQRETENNETLTAKRRGGGSRGRRPTIHVCVTRVIVTHSQRQQPPTSARAHTQRSGPTIAVSAIRDDLGRKAKTRTGDLKIPTLATSAFAICRDPTDNDQTKYSSNFTVIEMFVKSTETSYETFHPDEILRQIRRFVRQSSRTLNQI